MWNFKIGLWPEASSCACAWIMIWHLLSQLPPGREHGRWPYCRRFEVLPRPFPYSPLWGGRHDGCSNTWTPLWGGRHDGKFWDPDDKCTCLLMYVMIGLYDIPTPPLTRAWRTHGSAHSFGKLPWGCMFILFCWLPDVCISFVCKLVGCVMLRGPEWAYTYTPMWAARVGLRERCAISCYRLMVESLGWRKCIDPTSTGTGSASHYVACLLGQGRGMHGVVCTTYLYQRRLPPRIREGSSWPKRVARPPTIEEVACRLAHAVTKAKSEGVVQVLHYQSNPLPRWGVGGWGVLDPYRFPEIN